MTTTATPTSRVLNDLERAHLAHYRSFCPDAETIAEIDRMEAAWKTFPAPGPCPSFCTQPTGHGWVDDDPRADYGRYHSHDFGKNAEFHVSQFEAASADGTTTLLAPEVLPPLDAMKVMVDPLDVIDLAHAALDASSLLRAILTEQANEEQ